VNNALVVSRKSATPGLGAKRPQCSGENEKAIEESMRGLVIGGEPESYYVFRNGS
jgi:hypothetical protein